MLFACFGKKKKKSVENGGKETNVAVIYGNESYHPNGSSNHASSSLPLHISIPLDLNNNHSTTNMAPPLADCEGLDSEEDDEAMTSTISSDKKELNSLRTNEEYEIIDLEEKLRDGPLFRKLEHVEDNKIPRPFSQYERVKVLQCKTNYSLLYCYRNCISLPTYLDQIVVKPRQSLKPIDIIIHPVDPMPPRAHRKTRIPKRMSTSVNSHGDYEKLRKSILGRKYLLTKTADGNEWVRVGGGFEASEAFERRKSRLSMGRRRYGTSPDIFQYKIISVRGK